MRFAGQEARRGTRDVHTGFWRGKLRERDHVKDLGAYGKRIITMKATNRMQLYRLIYYS
jgi:hypothetical protein